MNNKKILITEDEPTLSTVLKAQLSAMGFVVLQARNGEECLEIALKKHPDIILLDIILPKMDGLMVLDKLREDGWGKNVPVIVLTNLSNAEDMENAIKRGARGYLVKSDKTLAEIVERVQKELNIRPGA